MMDEQRWNNGGSNPSRLIEKKILVCPSSVTSIVLNNPNKGADFENRTEPGESRRIDSNSERIRDVELRSSARSEENDRDGNVDDGADRE